MVLLPPTGLGRFLLGVIILSTVFYLVLNLVSFGGARWVTSSLDNTDYFGLWKICYTSLNGYGCSQWTSDIKPGFVRSCQALEIISLIFYVFAAGLIIIGIINFDDLLFQRMFLFAASLLFIAIVFLSATLGVMSRQGQSNVPSTFLDWAWWNGLIGLIMTIVCFVALIALVLDMKAHRATIKQNSTIQRGPEQNHTWGGPTVMHGISPPIIQGNNFPPNSYNYPNQSYNYPNQSYNYPNQSYNSHQNHYPQQGYYTHQPNSNGYFQDPMMLYGDQSAAQQYFHGQNFQGFNSDMAQYYPYGGVNAQYGNQFQGQYMGRPYMIFDYF